MNYLLAYIESIVSSLEEKVISSSFLEKLSRQMLKLNTENKDYYQASLVIDVGKALYLLTLKEKAEVIREYFNLSTSQLTNNKEAILNAYFYKKLLGGIKACDIYNLEVIDLSGLVDGSEVRELNASWEFTFNRSEVKALLLNSVLKYNKQAKFKLRGRSILELAFLADQENLSRACYPGVVETINSALNLAFINYKARFQDTQVKKVAILKASDCKKLNSTKKKTIKELLNAQEKLELALLYPSYKDKVGRCVYLEGLRERLDKKIASIFTSIFDTADHDHDQQLFLNFRDEIESFITEESVQQAVERELLGDLLLGENVHKLLELLSSSDLVLTNNLFLFKGFDYQNSFGKLKLGTFDAYLQFKSGIFLLLVNLFGNPLCPEDLGLSCLGDKVGQYLYSLSSDHKRVDISSYQKREQKAEIIARAIKFTYFGIELVVEEGFLGTTIDINSSELSSLFSNQQEDLSLLKRKVAQHCSDQIFSSSLYKEVVINQEGKKSYKDGLLKKEVDLCFSRSGEKNLNLMVNLLAINALLQLLALLKIQGQVIVDFLPLKKAQQKIFNQCLEHAITALGWEQSVIIDQGAYQQKNYLTKGNNVELSLGRRGLSLKDSLEKTGVRDDYYPQQVNSLDLYISWLYIQMDYIINKATKIWFKDSKVYNYRDIEQNFFSFTKEGQLISKDLFFYNYQRKALALEARNALPYYQSFYQKALASKSLNPDSKYNLLFISRLDLNQDQSIQYSKKLQSYFNFFTTNSRAIRKALFIDKPFDYYFGEV